MFDPPRQVGASGIEALRRNNETYAAGAHAGNRNGRGMPRTGVAVITCMDARIDVFAALGLSAGDAHVIRNAGGVVTDDVIRSLVISRCMLDTREIMLIHHTNCGMLQLPNDKLKRRLRAETGREPPFTLGGFADLDADVRQSIAAIRSNPFLGANAVRGFVYDVESGRLREVT
jgi:carbonic anhydrase